MLTLINHSFFFFTVILLIRSFAAIKQEFVNKIKDVQKKNQQKYTIEIVFTIVAHIHTWEKDEL